MTRFRNRGEAGRLRAADLDKPANRAAMRLIALPRGGVPVGIKFAQFLNAPVTAFVVRKSGVPVPEELALRRDHARMKSGLSGCIIE